LLTWVTVIEQGRGMIMSKKLIAILLTIFMVAAVGGCGVKDQVNEKITEKVTEGVINKALDGEGTIDIDGGKVSIKGEEGEEFSFGETEWPKDGAAEFIPKFTKGTISSVLNSNTACGIIIDEVEKSDFDQYVEEVKDQGFTVEPLEFISDTAATYSAQKDDNTRITVQYQLEHKVLTISAEIDE
jgi:hypothetical protein